MTSLRDTLPATIHTERLVLTTPSLTHVPEMAVLANNPRIYEVLERLPHPYDESHGRYFVETVARGPDEFAWSILLDGHYVGIMGLNLPPDRLPALGYWLGETHWGQGYATEAAHAVVAAAKASGYPGLRSRALLSNTGSRNVLRKAGFTEIGEDVVESGMHQGKSVVLLRQEFAQ